MQGQVEIKSHESVTVSHPPSTNVVNVVTHATTCKWAEVLNSERPTIERQKSEVENERPSHKRRRS